MMPACDVDKIRSDFDCRFVIEHDLGRPKGRSPKVASWKCPLHKEKRGSSLTAWADGWKCWGKCACTSDVIGWVMAYRNLDFKAACEYLTRNEDRYMKSAADQSRSSHTVTDSFDSPPADWRDAAAQLVEAATDCLWSEEGKKALAYLRGRGLWDIWIKQAKLGYVPGHYTKWIQFSGLNVPCGITFPSYAHGQLWQVRVRRAAGDVKYISVPGGKLLGSLFLGDEIDFNYPAPVIIVEGEIDALTLACCTHSYPVALSSASNRLSREWIDKLLFMPQIYSCLDPDPAGAKAAARLGNLSARVRPINVPSPHKDPNEFYLAAGHLAVSEWAAELGQVQA
jgi:DNA primase